MKRKYIKFTDNKQTEILKSSPINKIKNFFLPETSAGELSYMPQLDSLRTFAVLQVIISHWLQKVNWLNSFPFGATGVDMFFVLSGFLISGILLKSRQKAELNSANKIHSLKSFYIRRTLRIFPVYYLTIFFLFAISFNNIRENFLWYFLYASNIFYFITHTWIGGLSHLWSLAVEEQFYIVWPFLILFVPKKHLLKTIIVMLFTGPVFRTALLLLLGSSERINFITILTPSCMDCFGTGALLAYFRQNKIPFLDFKSRFSKILVLLTFLFMIFLIYYREIVNEIFPTAIDSGALFMFFLRITISVCSIYLISRASAGFDGIMGMILGNKVLIYLGKISYGLYLFHPLIPDITKFFGIPLFQNLYLRFVFLFIVLVILASLSWYLFERPMNNLKRFFSYN